MKLNSKGQVTIPAELRHKHGLDEVDEVDVVEDGNTLRIVHLTPGRSKGERGSAGCVAGRPLPGPPTS